METTTPHDCYDPAGLACRCREIIRIDRSGFTPKGARLFTMTCPLTDRHAVESDARPGSWDLYLSAFERFVEDCDRLDAEQWVRGELNPDDFDTHCDGCGDQRDAGDLVPRNNDEGFVCVDGCAS